MKNCKIHEKSFITVVSDDHNEEQGMTLSSTRKYRVFVTGQANRVPCVFSGIKAMLNLLI
jgi:hypothetical protein